MGKLEFAGNYNGKIVASKVDRTEKSALWMFVVSVSLTDFYNSKTRQVEKLKEPVNEVAYLMLQGIDKETGQPYPNENQIEAIQGFAPEWTDTDKLEVLHGLNLIGREVSVKFEAELYQGKTRLRASWVNRAGGMRETAKDVVAAMGSGWKTSKAPAAPAKENKPDTNACGTV